MPPSIGLDDGLGLKFWHAFIPTTGANVNWYIHVSQAYGEIYIETPLKHDWL